MAFKKHFKVLLPLLILVAQAVSGVFGIFLLFECLYSFDEYNYKLCTACLDFHGDYLRNSAHQSRD